MIYKILGDINEKNFDKIISNISKYYKFLFFRQGLYIALINFEQKDKAQELMKKTFRPVKNFYIQEITEHNLQLEDSFIIDWCRDSFVDLERQKYEIEQQKKLRQVMSAMDKMEEILQNNMLEKEATKNERKEHFTWICKDNI